MVAVLRKIRDIRADSRTAAGVARSRGMKQQVLRPERAYPKLIYYNKLDKGGHFAAWEQPKLFVEEVRAGFRSLRNAI
jgi:pimeloyl-ACP methyl ester carboxylesterase